MVVVWCAGYSGFVSCLCCVIIFILFDKAGCFQGSLLYHFKTTNYKLIAQLIHSESKVAP